MSVLTIGSLNLDHVLSVKHLVNPGDTLAASSLTTTAGGKGLNQSLAAVRAGATVLHAGAVGAGGLVLKDLLAQNGCDVHLIDEVDVEQGCAFIQVDACTGENAIVLFAGSNHALTDQRVDEFLDCVTPGDVVLLQNEVSGVTHALAACAERGIPCVLNPAPMSDDIAAADLSAVSWLVVNEVETAQLTGEREPDAVWAKVSERWPNTSLLLTRGEQGSVAYTRDERYMQPALSVQAVDTTGAGDTFLGYFVAGLEEGLPLPRCLSLATCASAVCVTRAGAAQAIPWRDEVEAMLT